MYVTYMTYVKYVAVRTPDTTKGRHEASLIVPPRAAT
jgi:hypothetical protein